MQSLSLTIFLPSPNNSHFPKLFPTLRQHRDNFETTWWQLCDHWQSVTLPCGQHMAIFHVLSIPKISGNGVLISDDIFSFKNIFLLFYEKKHHSMERQYELHYSSAIEQNTVFPSQVYFFTKGTGVTRMVIRNFIICIRTF